MTGKLFSITSAVLVLAMAACTSNQTEDRGIDSHSLVSLQAKVWVDPDGCKHWFVDDGIEGYLSPVLNPDGTPDCV